MQALSILALSAIVGLLTGALVMLALLAGVREPVPNRRESIGKREHNDGAA